MSLAAAARVVSAARHIVITTHVNPDGDGIGAALALAHAQRASGRRIELVFPSAVASTYAFLPGADAIRVCTSEAAARRRRPCDLLISVDCGDRERLGALWHQRRRSLLNIDHHGSNDGFGDIALVDTRVACTCQLVLRLLTRLAIALDATIATCCYVGLVYDTGRFMHGNTGVAEFRCAAALLKTGIDAAALNRQLTYCRSLQDLAIEALGLKHLRLDTAEPRLAGIALSRTAIARVGEPEDWGDLVDIPRSLRGVEIAYLARERDGGEVRVSLRSNPPYEVGPVAARFAGGGHAQAAGCTLQGGLRKALAQLLPLLREALA